MSTPIWLNDPTILLKQDNISELWPNAKMTTEEKINAITRLVILLTLFGYLLTLTFKIVYIGIITLVSIIVLYLIQRNINSKKLDKASVHEAFSNNLSNQYQANTNNFTKPTAKNPLMNILVPEIMYDPKRNKAAPAFNSTVEKNINDSVKEFIEKPFNDKNIHKKLFKDVGDEMMFNRSMLPWNSMPNTQIPNDLNAYKEFVYGNMISGKEGNPNALEKLNSGAYNYINP